ncbi:MAG: ABC transporter permease [Bacteroidota bacterium]
MNILRLSLSKIRSKPANALVSIILFAIGTGIISLVINGERNLKNQFSGNLAGIDLVVGAKGSPLQLILSSVFHIDTPTGNIPLAEAERISRNPMVEKTIPIALGDNHQGFRIVGTTPEYAALYQARLSAGSWFDKPYEAVIGAEVAQRTGLRTGDHFTGRHGFTQHGHHHDEDIYTVVGILEKSGTVIDGLILTTVDTYWMIHAGHHHNTLNEHNQGDLHEESGMLNRQHPVQPNHAVHVHGDECDHSHLPGHVHSDECDHSHLPGHIHSENSDHSHLPGHVHSDECDHSHIPGHVHSDECDHSHIPGHVHSDECDHSHPQGHTHHDGHTNSGLHENIPLNRVTNSPENTRGRVKFDSGGSGSDPDHTDREEDDEAAWEELIRKLDAREDLSAGEMALYRSRSGQLQETTTDPGKQITALLVFYSTPRAAVQLPRMINDNTSMQAASPAFETHRLFTLAGTAVSFLQWLAWIIIIISGLNVFIHLTNTLNQNLHEIALIRALGASRLKVMLLMILQGLWLAIAGGLVGILAGKLLLAWLPGIARLQGGTIYAFHSGDLMLLLLAAAAGILSALVPAIRAYRTDVHHILTRT